MPSVKMSIVATMPAQSKHGAVKVFSGQAPQQGLRADFTLPPLCENFEISFSMGNGVRALTASWDVPGSESMHIMAGYVPQGRDTVCMLEAVAEVQVPDNLPTRAQ